MNYTVRKGQIKDSARILKFIRDLAIQHNAEDMVVFTTEEFARVGFEIEKPEFRTFVAEAENRELIGCVVYFDRFSTWKGPSIHIEDIITDPQYRGLGVGKRLLNAVIEHAKERKANRIELDVEADNEGAVAFYHAQGFDVDKWFSAKLYLE